MLEPFYRKLHQKETHGMNHIRFGLQLLSQSKAPVSHFGSSRDPNLIGSKPGRVKPMTLKIDTRRFLARRLALLG